MAGLLKKLELANKAVWKRACRAALVRRRGAAPDLAAVRKVLFLRHDRIGDMIVSMPVLHGFKSMRQHAVVGVLAGADNARLVTGDPDVDHVHVLSKTSWPAALRAVLDARREGYEAVVNLNLNDSFTGALVANLVCPRGIKIARRLDGHADFYDVLVPIERDNRRSMVELLLPFLALFGPLPAGPSLQPRVHVGDGARQRVAAALGHLGIDTEEAFVAVNLSARRDATRWAEAGYVDLLRGLAEQPGEKRCVVFSDPADTALRARVATAVGSARVVAFPSTDDLMEVAALVERASLVITPDTSIVHFASATRTPVIGLYTTREPRPMEWQPYGVPHRSVFAMSGEPVAAIPAAQVLAAVDDLRLELRAQTRRGTG